MMVRTDSVRKVALMTTALTGFALSNLLISGQAEAQTVSDSSGVVTYTQGNGTFSAGTPSSGALVIAPTDYPANTASKTEVGFASTTAPTTTTSTASSTLLSQYPLSTTNGISSLSGFTSLSIGSSQNVEVGIKYVPPASLDTGGYAPYYSSTASTFLKNYEGVDLQVAGAVNNHGLITNAFNTSSGAAANANSSSGNSFYVATISAKVQPPGDPDTSDALPARTVGVWVNASGGVLNNYGSITLGVTSTSVPNQTLYTVLATDDSDFYATAKINNYGTIGAYNWDASNPSSANKASVQAVEVKENILAGSLYNASGGLIEAVANSTSSARSGYITTGGASGGIYTSSTYTKANGGYSNVSATAINTDNNTEQLSITNAGVIVSALATSAGSLSSNTYSNSGLETYNGFTGTAAVYNGSQYGTAIGDSVAIMYVTNQLGGSILGDITVGKQSSQFTFSNAGTFTGNLVITPDQSIGKSAVSSTGSSTIATSGLTISQTSLYGVYQSGGCIANCSTPGSLYYSATDDTQYATAATQTNRIVYAPVVNSTTSIGSLSGGIMVQNASGIGTANSESVTYQAGAAGSTGSTTYTNASAHPFQLVIAPTLASGVQLSSSAWTAFTYAGQNISIASGTYASTTGSVSTSALQSVTSGTINGVTCTSSAPCQYYNYTVNNVAAVTASNIYIQSTPLVKWVFAGQTGSYNPSKFTYVDTNGNTQSFTAMTAATATATNVVYAEAISPSSALPGLSSASNHSLTALINTGNALATSFQSITSTSALAKATEQLRPTNNGSTNQAANGASTKALSLIDSHLSEVNAADSDGGKGAAAGNDSEGLAFWAQGFGFLGNQGYREGTDGYSVESYGYTAGADTRYDTNSDIRLGAAVSYARTHVYDTGARQGDVTAVDSYIASLYGYVPFDGWYVDGSIAGALHHYSDEDLILTNIVTATHNGYQGIAKTDAGYPIKTDYGTYVPTVALIYSHLSLDSYTQSGTGGQTITVADTNSVRTGLGGRAVFATDEYLDKSSLEVRTAWYHEFGDNTQNTTAAFTGSSSSYAAPGTPQDRNSIALGASFNLTDLDDDGLTTLQISYDAEHKDQYLSHTGSVKVRFDF